ncbi:MAG: YraN family protein [Acidimicrobiales bacterium]
MDPNRALGQEGEDRAAAWYAAAGYRILERNWRTGQGEIDLLCVRGGLLVVCEVKTRRSDRHGHPSEAVVAAKRRRLRRLAAAYAAGSSAHFTGIRFDVASVLGGDLSVVEGAF